MALSISPDSPSVLVNLGNALAKRWELEEALLHYGEALRLKPDYDEAQLNFLSTQRMIESRNRRNRGF
jgi:tetratricopeptide (TPR) repeat protein